MTQIITDDMYECRDDVGRGYKIRVIMFHIKLDRMRNERIRGTMKVGEISKKVLKRRLK